MAVFLVSSGKPLHTRHRPESVRERRHPSLPALLVLVGIACSVIAAAGCGDANGDDPERAGEMVAEGSWYARQQWPHDGNPYVGETFVVYSDRAGAEGRREVAVVAEKLWQETLDEFGIEAGMLQYPGGTATIDIYAYRDYYPQEWGMRAYHGGLIMWSPDHDERPQAIEDYAPVVKHELVHVLEGLLKGRDAGHGEMTDVWFSEGLAEATVGGTSGGAVRSLHQMKDLTSTYGGESPISFKRDSQVTVPGAGYHFNYPMYQLAVEYLMNADGLSRSPEDARDVFLAMAGGASFREAFEGSMGISLDEYERTFFERMGSYLPQHRMPLFSPVGFAMLSAFTLFATSAVLVIAARRRRVGDTELAYTAPTRAATVGFGIGIAASAAITVAFTLGMLFVFGTVYELNNAMRAGARTVAYWTLAAYYAASIAVMVWAVDRRARRSRAAYLAAPLVIVATIGAFIVLAAAT